MAQLTLLDIAKRTGSDREIGLVEDVTTFAPELGIVPVRPINGVSFKTTLRTAYASGGFRAVGAGVVPSKSTYEQKLAECFYLDNQLVVDVAIPESEDRSVGDVLTDEAISAIRGDGISIANQLYYGTAADSKGFQGLQSFVGSSATWTIEGATSSTGTAVTSVYLVYLDLKGVHFIAGRTAAPSGGSGDAALPSGEPVIIGPPFVMPEWQRQQVTDPNDSTKRLMAWVSAVSGWIGLAYGSKYSAFRVFDLDTSANNGFTDAKAAKLLSLVPLHIRNSGRLRWFMNRQQAYMLQASRSATSITNILPAPEAHQTLAIGGQYAPFPTECQGIPIIPTDCLVNTETVGGA